VLDFRCNRFESRQISMNVREHSNLHWATTLACIAHKSFEIFERSKLKR
jgi:hypothetical protein